MTRDFLYESVLKHLNLVQIHPLHKAIIEECCENAIKSQEEIKELETLIFAVQVSFLTCLSALKGTLVASLKFADTVTLNYREQTFNITKDSVLLK